MNVFEPGPDDVITFPKSGFSAQDGSIIGTIGGGCVEADGWQAARDVMKDEKPKTLTFNLDQTPDKDIGLACGGTLQIFVEPILPTPVLYIFGAGHIGLNVYKIAQMASFDVVIVDDRDSYANRERFPGLRNSSRSHGQRNVATEPVRIFLHSYSHQGPPP